MTWPRRPKIAIATGDAGGIGAEIAIKAARDVRVREACWPILVSDHALLDKHARASGLASGFHVVELGCQQRSSHAAAGITEYAHAVRINVALLAQPLVTLR